MIFADCAIAAARFLAEPFRVVDAPASYPSDLWQCACFGLLGLRYPYIAQYIVLTEFARHCLVACHTFAYTATHDNPLVFSF